MANEHRKLHEDYDILSEINELCEGDEPKKTLSTLVLGVQLLQLHTAALKWMHMAAEAVVVCSCDMISFSVQFSKGVPPCRRNNWFQWCSMHPTKWYNMNFNQEKSSRTISNRREEVRTNQEISAFFWYATTWGPGGKGTKASRVGA